MTVESVAALIYRPRTPLMGCLRFQVHAGHGHVCDRGGSRGAVRAVV